MSSKTKTTAKTEEATPALVPKLRFPEFRGAEGWHVEYLGGICAPQQWTTISSTDLVDRGYPVYGANGFIGYYTDFNHEFETVAVTCRGSTCGEVTLIPPKSYITGNSMCLDGIDAVQNSYHFVYQLLKHRGFDDIISGSAQPQIVGNAIKRLRIALPKKPEQQKIAECLSSVDELIAAQARKLDALKTHKKGLMQQLFPREGETQPRLRFPEFQNAGEWDNETMQNVFGFRQGLQVAVEHQFLESGENRKRFIRIIDVTQNNEPPRYIIVSNNANVLSASDLFMVRYGTPGLVSIGFEGIIANNLFQLVFRIRKNHMPLYWYYYLQTKYEEISGLSGSSSMPAISFKTLNIISVIFPLLPEQQRIADCLTSLDDLIAAQTQTLEALKTHKQGLMQQLFPNSSQSAT